LLTAPFGFAYALLCIVLTNALAATIAGLYLPGWLVVGARGWGSMFRGYARLFGTDIPAPLPRRPIRGFWSGLARTIGDCAGWRAVLFLMIAFPLAIISTVLVLVFLIMALGFLTYWFWYRYLPAQQAADGTWHRGSLW